MSEVVVSYGDGLTQPQSFPLFTKHLATHLQHHLESLPSSCSIFSKSFNTRFFDLIPYLLPSTTESYYLSLLCEFGPLSILGSWLVNNSLSALQQVGPGYIGATHCDLLLPRIDVGNFVNLTCGVATKYGQDPLRSVLFAGNESFRS